MRFGKILRGATVGLACWGLLMPQTGAFGDTNTAVKRQQAAVADVALRSGGALLGRVVDGQGKAVDGALISVTHNGKTVARTTSRRDGQYVVTGLRGGLHVVVAGSTPTPVRFWAEGTAPSSARTSVLSVTGTTVRGQQVEYYPPEMAGYASCPQPCPPSSGFGCLDIITLATVGLATGALVVAIDNNDKLDDLQDAVASP